MNVIIAGAGEVGGHAAEALSADGHNVTIIDHDQDKLGALAETLDVRTLVGNCAHLRVLHDAGVEHCDLLLSATSFDEINMLTASMAKIAGAKSTLVRVHHTDNFSLKGTEWAAKLGIDDLICPEHLTATAIARTLRNPGSFALEEFGRGDIVMQRLHVSPGSAAVGKLLMEIELPSSTRLATVERESGATIVNARTLISENDYVTVIGEKKAFEAARKIFDTGKAKRQSVSIMGDTATAVWVCRALKGKAFSVRLFASNHDRAEELSEKLDFVTVLDADPTDTATFKEEHLESVDTFIAVTDDDERNILACAQAKAMGATVSIAVVQRSTYLHLFPHVGIDCAFSPRSDAVKAIRHLLDKGPCISLATFADDIAEVYQIRPSKKAKVLGHELRNIKLPSQAMIAAIQSDERVFVPGAEDKIAHGDTILAVGPRGIAEELVNIFSPGSK